MNSADVGFNCVSDLGFCSSTHHILPFFRYFSERALQQASTKRYRAAVITLNDNVTEGRCEVRVFTADDVMMKSRVMRYIPVHGRPF